MLALALELHVPSLETLISVSESGRGIVLVEQQTEKVVSNNKGNVQDRITGGRDWSWLAKHVQLSAKANSHGGPIHGATGAVDDACLGTYLSTSQSCLADGGYTLTKMQPLPSRALRGVRRGHPRLLASSGWICGSCQPRRIAQARWKSSDSSTTTSTSKPYYVTTPIFYVNAGMDADGVAVVLIR
jgi:hypothetical protein